jgi:hypothetical protein
VAFIGTLNPSAGDVSLFLPIEHACLAEASQAQARTALFARYSLAGALAGALGALLAGVPDWVAAHSELSALSAMRVMFMVCALSGLAILILYLYMPSHQPATTNVPAALAGACLGDRNE